MIYCYDTITNKLIGQYDTVQEGAWANDLEYSSVYHQLIREKISNLGGYIRTHIYFSRDILPKAHNIVICKYEDGTVIKCVTPKHASNVTSVADYTIKRCIRDGHSVNGWTFSNETIN